MYKIKILCNIIMNTFARDLKIYCLPEFISFYDKCNDQQQTIIEKSMLCNIDICNDMFNIVCNQLHVRGINLKNLFMDCIYHFRWFDKYLPLLFKLDYQTELGLLTLLNNSTMENSLIDCLKTVQIFKYTLPRASIDEIEDKFNIINITNMINTHAKQIKDDYSHISHVICNVIFNVKFSLIHTIFEPKSRDIDNCYPLIIEYFILKCYYAMVTQDYDLFKEFHDLYISHVNSGLYNEYDYFKPNDVIQFYFKQTFPDKNLF